MASASMESLCGLIFTYFLLTVSIINTEKTEKQVPVTKHVSSSDNPDIKDIVRNKVIVLLPLLDDDKRDDSDDSQESAKTNEVIQAESTEDSDRSTDEETLDNNTARRNNHNPARKDRNIRQKIEKLLKTESISDDTKKVVRDALDKITEELSEDCMSRKRNKDKHDQPSIVIPNILTKSELSMQHIKEKWDKITKQYVLKSGHLNKNEAARQAAFLFLTRLRHFVFDVDEDYKKLQQQYALKCDSTDVDDKVDKKGKKKFNKKASKLTNDSKDSKSSAAEKEALTETEEMIHKSAKVVAKVPLWVPKAKPQEETSLIPDAEECNPTICSGELTEFLMDFYRRVNETQSEIFRNYIEMYLKEIDTGKEDTSVTKLLLQLKKHVGINVKEIYANDTAGLTLIPNFAATRIEILKRFVDKTITNVKEAIKISLSDKLKKLPTQLRFTVKRDLQTTVNIELGNLQNDFKSNMCKVFQTCNGVGARRESAKTKTAHVKLGKKTLKDIAEKIKKLKAKENGQFSDLENYIYHMDNNKNTSLRKMNANYKGLGKPPFDMNKYKNVKITRTTHRKRTRKATTKNISK